MRYIVEDKIVDSLEEVEKLMKNKTEGYNIIAVSEENYKQGIDCCCGNEDKEFILEFLYDSGLLQY